MGTDKNLKSFRKYILSAERRKTGYIGNYTGKIMIIECDNRECLQWMKMSDPILKNMAIDLSKVYISVSIENNKYLTSGTGKSNKPDKIYIRNDLQFGKFIQTYAHEVGHITQKLGIFENPNKFITGIIAESIALKFEKKFLIKFNKKYNTNIPIDENFNGLNRYTLAYYGKNLAILSTKSKYKFKKQKILKTIT